MVPKSLAGFYDLLLEIENITAVQLLLFFSFGLHKKNNWLLLIIATEPSLTLS